MENFSSDFSFKDDGSLLVLSRTSTKDNELPVSTEPGELSQDENETDDCDDLSLGTALERIISREQDNLLLAQIVNEKIAELVIATSNDATSSAITVDATTMTDTPVLTEEISPNVKTPKEKEAEGFSVNEDASKGVNDPAFAHFIQDYYQSLTSVSRYMILATILGFATASIFFCFTHSQALQRDIANQQTVQKTQHHYENFREQLIHQSYEERRECHATKRDELSELRRDLRSCQIKRDELTDNISKVNQQAVVTQAKLEGQVEIQRIEIKALTKKLQDLEKRYEELEKKNESSYKFSLLDILYSLLSLFSPVK